MIHRQSRIARSMVMSETSPRERPTTRQEVRKVKVKAVGITIPRREFEVKA